MTEAEGMWWWWYVWLQQEMQLERRKLRCKWKPYTYVNGVSVFLENSGKEDTGSNASFMTSIVVRAPPVLCVQEVCCHANHEKVAAKMISQPVIAVQQQCMDTVASLRGHIPFDSHMALALV